MSAQNLTVAEFVEDHIDGIHVGGDAFGDLLADLADASREDLLAFDGFSEKNTDRIIADISQRMDERGGDQ